MIDIAALRKKLGMSAVELAAAIDVTPGFISQVENGKTVPTPMFIKLFCLTFSVNEEQFHEK